MYSLLSVFVKITEFLDPYVCLTWINDDNPKVWSLKLSFVTWLCQYKCQIFIGFFFIHFILFYFRLVMFLIDSNSWWGIYTIYMLKGGHKIVRDHRLLTNVILFLPLPHSLLKWQNKCFVCNLCRYFRKYDMMAKKKDTEVFNS